MNRLLAPLQSREARVGVIGLGYVGLPLALAFVRAGLNTVGFDVDSERTAAIGRGESYFDDVPPGEVEAAVESGALAGTTDFASWPASTPSPSAFPRRCARPATQTCRMCWRPWIAWRRICAQGSSSYWNRPRIRNDR
jgi:hypothetical protein